MNSYPEDLIPVIRKAYSGKPKQKDEIVPPLPTDDVLRALLDTSYHASFEAEEHRRPGFRLMLYSPTDHKRPSAGGLGEGKYYAKCFRLILLDKERPFDVAEVNRLAPAAELKRLIICVHCKQSGLSTPALFIWSLLDVGENWWKFVHHEASGGMPPPNFLTVSSTGPGEISISAEGLEIASLKGGRISFPSEGALWRGPLSDFLDTARKQLYADVTAHLGRKKWDPDRTDDDYPHLYYNFFLERILFYTRRRRHGGTIILIPNYLAKDDTRLTDRVNIKYPCRYDLTWDLLIRSLVNHRLFYDLHFPLWDGKRPCTQELFHEYCMLVHEEKEIDEALSDVAQTVASLTSVDGAVIMNERFDVLGFGVEVIAPSPSLSHVKVMGGSQGPTTIPVESFGTRHRSAFRFCSSLEESIAFVLSQDGGVKAVKRHGKDVFLWPSLNAGGFGI